MAIFYVNARRMQPRGEFIQIWERSKQPVPTHSGYDNKQAEEKGDIFNGYF